MPAKIIITSTIIGTLLTLGSSISQALLIFFLAGIVPGTNIVLNPGTMLLLLSVTGIILLIAIITAKTAHAKTIRKTLSNSISSKHLPTRRFSNL